MRAPEPPQEPKPLATAKLVVRKVKPASELNKPKLKRWVELINVSWAFWVRLLLANLLFWSIALGVGGG